MEEAILEANEEEGVDGIMVSTAGARRKVSWGKLGLTCRAGRAGCQVYYPIHGGSRDQYLQQCVSPLKDVEGLHHQFLFNLYHK